MRLSALMISAFLFQSLWADTKVTKPRYKSGGRIDFESLLIEGEKRKADYSVVTGNLGEEDFGLIKLREDFLDLMALDSQEEVQ
ncbi:MAG: hypothetical protein CME65_06440 [Halobacteriovoraceae bacterium]|nr:hypothetical protein [Halobacteriovoraceae bacterium]|tara:strand:- start:1482 stop:1733 length:252 start_codon:yes stop_codon:yes gene_type:complete